MSYKYMYQEALIEGINEGRAEGRAKGRAEGKTEGKTEEQLATAKRMLAKGSLPLELIAEMTLLDLSELQKLQAEMQPAH